MECTVSQHRDSERYLLVCRPEHAWLWRPFVIYCGNGGLAGDKELRLWGIAHQPGGEAPLVHVGDVSLFVEDNSLWLCGNAHQSGGEAPLRSRLVRAEDVARLWTGWAATWYQTSENFAWGARFGWGHGGNAW